jgi:arabinofuranosyltransferase
MSPTTQTGRLAILVALTVYGALAWRFQWTCDDAFISFRYAEHFGEGAGLRFNLLREVPVEGYSNFLWVVWLGALSVLGISIPLAAHLSSGLCGAALVAWFTLHAKERLELSQRGAVLAGLFFASLPPVGLWATSGLAAMPLALALFGVYARLFDRAGPRRGAWGWALFAVFVRADGLLWVGLIVLAALSVCRRGERAGLRRAALQTACVAGAAFGLHALWRYGYYGEWIPNTARVKAGASAARLQRGLGYVGTWLLALPAITIVLAYVPFVRRRIPSEVLGPAAVLVCGGAFYATWVGGDFMPFGRFLVPALPFVGLLFAAVFCRAETPRMFLTGALLCVLAFLSGLDLNPVPATLRELAHFRHKQKVYLTEVEYWQRMQTLTARNEVLARALALHTAADESLVFGPIGVIGFYTQLELYDKFGLVTPEAIDAGTLLAKATPGHDLFVEDSFFLTFEPTYTHAFLTLPAGMVAPAEGLPFWTRSLLPTNWQRMDWAQHAKPERVPLESPEFPENCELVLVRRNRSD